jgi:mono/diheme cytochrome c family protein
MRRFFDNLIADLHLPLMPFWMVSGVIVFVVATWVPLALVARARVTMSTQPRVHLFLDMDKQPRFNTQVVSPVFADRRTMRPPVEGAVARGHLREDAHLYEGFRVVDGQVEYFVGMPEAIDVDERLLMRGKVQYDIHCFPCHGLAGRGDGPVHRRAEMLSNNPATGTRWVPPSNLVAIDEATGQLTYGPELYSDGQMYNAIVHGVRNMPGYGDQMSVRDRWATVAYIRALQLNQHQPNAATQQTATAE